MITINPDKIIVPNSIALGQKFVVDSGFGADEKVTMFDELLTAKESAIAAGNPELVAEQKPKLVAVYAWMQTVKELAKQGSTTFPPAPFTFQEVISE